MSDVAEKLIDYEIQILRELSAAARENMNPEAYYFIQGKLEERGQDVDITGAEHFTRERRPTDINHAYVDTSNVPEPSDPNYIGKRIHPPLDTAV